jgi:nucleotidyltransferase AbiEii toxin of type IV toxin-antitoxin system
VKLEVDTNPPAGAVLATTLVRRHVTLNLQHHDPASLLAGKLHAVLQRPYPKGRDFYDLLWYLSDPQWPAPNLVLLNNALRQTGWTGAEVTNESWRALVLGRIEGVDWGRIIGDVKPFLEDSAEIDLLNHENLFRLLTLPPLR